jgi:hypothetical protein
MLKRKLMHTYTFSKSFEDFEVIKIDSERACATVNNGLLNTNKIKKRK